MDIAALSINLKQVQLQQEVGTAVLKMAMDSSRENADMLTEILAASTTVMEQAVNPHLGVRLDITA
jgi:hypothetical protein